MIPHVHTPSQKVETWGVNGMKSHLEHDHPDVPLPMRWGRAELHQAHLKAHQTPEETPVPEVHSHGDIASYHAHTDRRSVAYHLEEAHDLDRKDIDLREIYSQHASLHPMKACGEENPQYPGEYTCEYPAGHGPVIDPDDGDMPITGTFDHGAPSKGVWWTMPPAGTAEADKVENLAQLLYERNASSTETDWDDLGQETRDHYRDRARTSLARVRDGRVNRVNQAEPTEGERRILEDRIICAMTGLDFDGDWVKDESLSLRRAMRYTYAATADRLVTWLNRGGAMHLAPVASLAEDLTTAQKLQHAAESDRDKTAEDLARERALVEDLEEANNQLRHQLADSEQRRQGLFEGMGELRQQLETAVATRDRAMEAGYRLEHERDEAQTDFQRVCREKQDAQDALYLLQGQWERVVPHLESRLMARTEALANGQAALGELISGLNQGTVPLTSGGIMFRLEKILAGQESVTACTEPHLGLARTSEILAELTSRIDLGHCGLEYRTVDGD